ncbi:MAG: calcium/proton exchanger [Cyanobacteriota bacterium ELA615]|jgi:Ca2+:H+ antiporter
MSIDKIVKLMLIFVPITLLAQWLHLNHVLVFLLSVLAITPLAALIAETTELIALVIGPTFGGLLNATFGNLTEMVVSIVALRSGLIEVVKASILGSVIANLLLGLGLSMFLGGIRFKEQTFHPEIARLNASALLLSVLVLVTPSAIHLTSTNGLPEVQIQRFSYAASLLLLIFYALTIFFFNKKRKDEAALLLLENPEAIETHSISMGKQIAKLLSLTVFLVIISEILVGNLEETIKIVGFSELFTGTFLLPLFSGIVEYITCISAATKNQMELAVSVAIGSTLQITLFVTPILVLISLFMKTPLTLEFNVFVIFAAVSSVLIINSISSDGNSNWLEGILLLIFYSVLGFAFYLHP